MLHEHLERFQEVFEEAAIGMATMTLTGRMVRGNRSLARIVGHPVAELVGASYADLAGPDAERVRAALRQVVEDGDDLVRLEHRVDGSGPERRVLTMLSPVRDVSGRPLYLFLQVQDVSRAARRDGRSLRLLVDAVQDYAIFMLDPDGHVTSWNRRSRAEQGLDGRGDHRPALPRLLPTGEAGRAAPRARARGRAARGPLRGGGVADPQGRIAVLGARDDHGGPGPGRPAGRIREGDPGQHRAPRGQTRGSRRPTPGCSRPPTTSRTSWA